MAQTVATVADYIATRPESVRPLLSQIRSAVIEAVPAATETIAYGMPSISIGGRTLMSYAAWAKHIGVYPIPEGDAEFQQRIAPYRDAKSTAKFPLTEPVPVDLIAAMARNLAAERG